MMLEFEGPVQKSFIYCCSNSNIAVNTDISYFWLGKMQNNMLWNLCASWNQILQEGSLGGSWHKLFVLTWQKKWQPKAIPVMIGHYTKKKKNSWETCRIMFLGKLRSHHTFISIFVSVNNRAYFVWISKIATTTGLILTWGIYIYI